MRIVETDNFGGDYPDEKFHLGIMNEGTAKAICALLNAHYGLDSSRHYKAVPNDYELAPGFEP